MKTLFDTTRLRRHTLKNRIWRSATWLALADAEGNVTDEIVRTYEELAKGGAAMIVTGLTSIAQNDAEIGGGAKFYDDRFIAGHKRLTDAIHKHGALVMMQTAINVSSICLLVVATMRNATIRWYKSFNPSRWQLGEAASIRLFGHV